MKYTKYTQDYCHLHPYKIDKDLKVKNINVYFAAFFMATIDAPFSDFFFFIFYKKNNTKVYLQSNKHTY